MVSVEPNLGVDLGLGVEYNKKFEGDEQILNQIETLTLT
jgi:hypothetical protein